MFGNSNALDATKYQLPPLDLKITILFPGTLNYGRMSMRLLVVKEVFPLIKAKDAGVRLNIVGRQPCPEVKVLHNIKNIFDLRTRLAPTIFNRTPASFA